MNKRQATFTALADRLGILDRMNMTAIQEGITGPCGDPLLRTDAAVIRMALEVTASVVRAGMFDQFRPGFTTLRDNVAATDPVNTRT